MLHVCYVSTRTVVFTALDTLILSLSEIEILANLLKMKNIGSTFKLLYRASRDGFSYDEFLNRCKDYESTICIISTATNNVFGGYTSIKWQDDNRWRADDSAFLFLLRSSKGYEPDIFDLIPSQRKYALCHYHGYMCCFGLGHEIYMSFDAEGKILGSQQNQGTYNIPKSGYLNGDKTTINPEEIEVFAVCQ